MLFKKYRDLLKSLGFQSFLWTQFLGAFNDNAYKIVLSLIAVNISYGSGGGGAYVSLVGAVFILPFFIFSGYAGFLADAYNKRSVLIYTKSLEIIAMALTLPAFWLGRIEIMLVILFLMALQSTFFSPAKYGILPEMLPEKELSRANGLLEMSTFIAIILGTAAGSIVFSVFKDRLGIVGVILFIIAIIGTLTSFGITKVPGVYSGKSFSWNPWTEISGGLKTIVKSKVLFFSVAGITYFWFLGALLQMDILLLGKEVMGLGDSWTGILITFLGLGIGFGSIMAGRLSGDKIEPGLVPLGSLGMAFFSIILSYSHHSYALTAVSLLFLGYSGGLFIVPLNAILQQKSAKEEKGRIIGTNNFVNTGGILLASLVFWIMRDILDIQADRIIFIFGIVTLFSTGYVVKRLPDYLLRFVLWFMTHTLYRIRIIGKENVPQKGPALIVCNHVSFADAMFVGACVHRFIRFMIYRSFYEMKSIRWFLRIMRVIPIADGNRREVLLAIEKARQELKAGHVVCIFAEGMLTRTGHLLPFKKGFERIVEGLDVPVVPVHLDRVWGSVFSFKGGAFFWKMPSQFPYPVTVSFGAPLRSPGVFQARQAVMELGSEAMEHRRATDDMLHLRFMKTARRRWRDFCMADSTGKRLTFGNALVAGILLSKFMRKADGEQAIGIMLPASVAGALANIAALMAGKTAVNLNFMAGKEAIRSALNQSGVKTIVTSRAFLSKMELPEEDGMVFLEDALAAFSDKEKAMTAALAYVLPSAFLKMLFSPGKKDPGRLATIIFTSGSTALPKGVMLTHHNIISNIEGISQIFHLTKKDTMMGALPLFHSFGYTGTVWFPLVHGFGAVYHVNPMDAKTIGHMSKEHGATIIIGTPTFYNAYIKKCGTEEFKTLRYAVAGAEKLKDGTAREFREKFGLDLLEGYGCTELSPVVSVNVPDYHHKNIQQTGHKPGTVGHPIPGVSARVADIDTGKMLGPGMEGMLLIKGPNVMKGYLGMPEETQKALKDGWYVTGDIASMDADGFIKIVDRVSRFSKLGGEMVPHLKVEEEIIAAARCAAIVTSVPDEAKGERLVAFYAGTEMTPDELWHRLQGSGLPKLWIPKKDGLHRIDEIPLTGTGKADLRRIKRMALEMYGAGKR